MKRVALAGELSHLARRFKIPGKKYDTVRKHGIPPEKPAVGKEFVFCLNDPPRARRNTSGESLRD
jgi:hypothetical protein